MLLIHWYVILFYFIGTLVCGFMIYWFIILLVLSFWDNIYGVCFISLMEHWLFYIGTLLLEHWFKVSSLFVGTLLMVLSYGSSNHWFIGTFWFVGTCRFTGTCWFVGIQYCWFIGSLVHWFIGLLVHCWNFNFVVHCFGLFFLLELLVRLFMNDGFIGTLFHWFTGSLFVLGTGTLILLVHLVIHLNIYWFTGSKVQQRQICVGLWRLIK